MKHLSIAATLLLLSCQQVLADAPVTDRSVAAEQVEAAQLRADLAWKKLDQAKYAVTRAQQDVSAAEQADRVAQQRAQETARQLQAAHSALTEAQERQKQADADLQNAQRTLDQLWGNKARPR